MNVLLQLRLLRVTGDVQSLGPGWISPVSALHLQGVQLRMQNSGKVWPRDAEPWHKVPQNTVGTVLCVSFLQELGRERDHGTTGDNLSSTGTATT